MDTLSNTILINALHFIHIFLSKKKKIATINSILGHHVAIS